jgi:hypothetical protein
MTLKDLSGQIAVAIVSPVLLGILALVWNWSSSGGLAKAIGAATPLEVRDIVKQEIGPLKVTPFSEKVIIATDWPYSRGDGLNDTRAQQCPDNTTLIGGACDCGENNILQSYPGNAKGWFCKCSGKTPDGVQIAYAICTRNQ